MKRQIAAAILAGAMVTAPVCGAFAPAMSAGALTIIATPTSVTIPKGVIAVGETMRIDFKWGTGAVPDTITFSSHDDDIATVDQGGLITGVGTGITEIYVDIDSIGKSYTFTVTVSENAQPNYEYSLYQLDPGMKLNAGDTLVDDGASVAKTVNLLNDKGEYDVIHMADGPYTMQTEAMVVGLDGIILYIVPLAEGFRYTDITLLKEGDIIDTDTFLVTHDYVVNNRIHPVFLKSYYSKYIGEGKIRVKSIDHEKMRAELEAISEETTTIKGDANGDGVFGIADVVTFSKWLLGDTSAVIADWKTLDYNDDGALDTFDLITMRGSLAVAAQAARPVAMIADLTITEDPEKGWDSVCSLEVIDDLGVVHTGEITRDDFEVLSDFQKAPSWWKDNCDLIMSKAEARALVTEAEDIRAVKKLAGKAGELAAADWSRWDMSICDYGEKILYVMEPGETKYAADYTPVLAAEVGDECGWVKDEEAQDIITMMMEKDYFASSYIIKNYRRFQALPAD